MKLSETQQYHLRILSEQRGPMLGSTLAGYYVGVRQPTFDALVSKSLARVRKTAGRKDRYEILAAGRALLKQPAKR